MADNKQNKPDKNTPPAPQMLDSVKQTPEQKVDAIKAPKTIKEKPTTSSDPQPTDSTQQTQTEQNNAPDANETNVSEPPKPLSPKAIADIEQTLKQQRVLNALFPESLNPKKKKPYNLSEWYRERSTDLSLFLGMGFITKLEYSYYFHRMEQQTIYHPDSDRFSLIPIDGHEDPLLDEPTFGNLLRRFDFDKHENLLLRMQKPLALVGDLDTALLDEAIRSDTEGDRNVTQELLIGRTRPPSEDICWLEMNRMVGTYPRDPFDISLIATRDSLFRLNHYRLYRALANIDDFSRDPVIKQRDKNGHLVKMHQDDVKVRVQTALAFLEQKKFIDHDKLDHIVQLTQKQRDELLLGFKRDAVAAFLGDITNEAPTKQWENKLAKAFSWYFHPILEVTGQPTIQVKQEGFQSQDGKTTYYGKAFSVSFKQPPQKSPSPINVPNHARD